MKITLRRLPQYFKKYIVASKTNKWHIIFVICAAIYYRLSIILLPRKVVYSWLGNYKKRSLFCVIALPRQLRQAQKTGRFVENVCNKLPFNASCLVQSLIMRHYLNQYQIPYLIHVGLAKKYQQDEMKLSAHAWVCVGPLVVIGGKFFHEFKVLSTYVSCELNALPLANSKID